MKLTWTNWTVRALLPVKERRQFPKVFFLKFPLKLTNTAGTKNYNLVFTHSRNFGRFSVLSPQKKKNLLFEHRPGDESSIHVKFLMFFFCDDSHYFYCLLWHTLSLSLSLVVRDSLVNHLNGHFLEVHARVSITLFVLFDFTLLYSPQQNSLLLPRLEKAQKEWENYYFM